MLRSGSQKGRNDIFRDFMDQHHHHHHHDHNHSEGSESEGCYHPAHQHQLEIAERIVIIQKKNMLDMLAMFRQESGELRKLKEERHAEQFIFNKFLKKEVIDIAEKIEEIQEQVMVQSDLIHKQNVMMGNMMAQMIKMKKKVARSSNYTEESSESSEESSEESS
jgi:hypothetical protein